MVSGFRSGIDPEMGTELVPHSRIVWQRSLGVFLLLVMLPGTLPNRSVRSDQLQVAARRFGPWPRCGSTAPFLERCDNARGARDIKRAAFFDRDVGDSAVFNDNGVAL